MKKPIALLALLLCIIITPVCVSAAPKPDAKVVQAFSQGGALCAYLDIAEWDGGPMTAQVAIGNERYNDAALVTAIAELNPPVHYMLLVDNSTSMPGFAQSINAFARALLDSAGDNALFMLATFGKGFELHGEFTGDREAVFAELAALKYDEKQTSLYGGISAVIDHYENMERVGNELYNIIVITDGIEVDKTGVRIEELTAKILGSSVTIHTLGFPNMREATKAESEQALKDLGSFARASMGLDSVVGYGLRTEADMAGDITGYVHSLYGVKFDISDFKSGGGEYSVTFTFHSLGERLGQATKNVVIPISTQNLSPPSSPPIPMLSTPPTSPPTSSPTPSAASAATPEPSAKPTGSAPADMPTNAPTDAPTDAPDQDSPSSAGTEAEEVSQEAQASRDIKPFLLIGGAALLLLAGGAAFMLLKKKKRSRAVLPGHKIFVKLDVIDGQFAGRSNEFYLIGELIIGRSKSCDIVFKDKDVSARNSRVFCRDNVIYIEDIGSQNGTAISDMRIHAANRLRSGDVISIGQVRFTLKF